MNKAFKYELDLTDEQRESISKTLGCVRKIYNLMLNDKISHYEQFKENLKVNPTDYKNNPEYSYMKEVDSQALCSSWTNLMNAFNNFFKYHDKYGVGFPKFKCKKNKQSYTTHNGNNDTRIQINEENQTIKIPKIGWVKMFYHRPIQGKIKHITVEKTHSYRYFVSVLCELTDSEALQMRLKPVNKVIGIDLGLKEFAVMSDGTRIDNPKFLKTSEKHLKKLQKDLARCQKDSKNREKTRIKLAKQHEQIKNQRSDFHHKLSRKIINENQVIVFEDLKVKGMLKNHNLSKSISDVGWSSFIQMIKYKSEWAGREIIQVNQWFPSSQLCSVCDHKNVEVKSLSVRRWVCDQCGSEHDRDLNASINILKEGLKSILEYKRPYGTKVLASVNLSGLSDIEEEAVMSLA